VEYRRYRAIQASDRKEGERIMEYGFVCGYCDSKNVYIVQTFKGEFVEPDPKGCCDRGIVVKCRDCNDVTGYLIEMTGVVPVEVSK